MSQTRLDGAPLNIAIIPRCDEDDDDQVSVADEREREFNDDRSGEARQLMNE